MPWTQTNCPLSVYSTQGWALMRLTVIWLNIQQPSSVRRAAGLRLLMSVWAAEDTQSLLLSFQSTLPCLCRSGNMKCQKVCCACLKMSEIQHLVVQGSARGWREIKGESRAILLKITTTSLQRVFFVMLTFLALKRCFLAGNPCWNKNSSSGATYFVLKPKMQMPKQFCYFSAQHGNVLPLYSVSIGSLLWLDRQVLSVVKFIMLYH